MKMFITSPFEGLKEHAEIVKECSWTFQQAIECYISHKCQNFEEFRQEVSRLESQADNIKRRIRGHLPVGTLMPVSKFQLFRYLREQDGVMDAMQDALDWISYRSDLGLPVELEKDFFLLVNAVSEPIEVLYSMLEQAHLYFKTYNRKQRDLVKEKITHLRKMEHEADLIEDTIKKKVFHLSTDSITIYHLVRLAEILGSIADHAENAGDMMRAMVAR
jgi:hypothetical protein